MSAMYLPDDAGSALTGLARDVLTNHFDRFHPVTPPGSWAEEPGASFVTLRRDGDLRGCIGTLIAHQSLAADVRNNALAAAFEDPRFPPLSVSELAEVEIEVSILSKPEPMAFSSKDEALAALRPGVDGVVLHAHSRRATFLPQVWDELGDPEQFIGHLMRKAGLPADFWDESVRMERYTVTAFEESGLS